mmetsp:Transcript_17421/g.28111  ORF Transcript_17421/g.28111 Transcript_17421/m.28111 type:complete len:91 (+) Transcript_17421:1059-1331(+)
MIFYKSLRFRRAINAAFESELKQQSNNHTNPTNTTDPQACVYRNPQKTMQHTRMNPAPKLCTQPQQTRVVFQAPGVATNNPRANVPAKIR